jgi:hypothetical protein
VLFDGFQKSGGEEHASWVSRRLADKRDSRKDTSSAWAVPDAPGNIEG